MPAPSLPLDQVVRLWLTLQGHQAPRSRPLTRRRFVDLLEQVGALQLDSIHVLDRAHHLTLWSRFGAFDRDQLAGWVYGDQVAYEYWGHEASLLPISHLPLGRRRMRGFPDPVWQKFTWWRRFQTSAASKRRVLRRLRAEGPLESAHFTAAPRQGPAGPPVASVLTAKEDSRSLKLLWHAGRVAIAERRHFRCVYDLAERVYPEGGIASPSAYADSWLLQGLRGNGVASEAHLANYLTAPALTAAERRQVIARNLRKKRIREVRVAGRKGAFYALPEHLDRLASTPAPQGTTLICPFDSLLWQRRRAEELLGFRYRVEIYVPPHKREHGYYVMPILHDGRLVGRVDPKLHRERDELELRSLALEPGVGRDERLERGLRESITSLATFAGARTVTLPRPWRTLL
ncbi:MAG: crosslink repair DNA glycosylase YcaQ family protein [Candidatus Krumholzibacteriia bacterium]